MTLEEAKKKIRNYMKQSKDDYNRFEDDICRGEADAYSHALSILEQVATASVGNPDKMTLKELAHELRKIFEFDILTYSSWEDGDCYVTEQLDEIVLWFRRVPDALPEYDETAGKFYGDDEVCALLKISSMSAMVSESLDLSEYKDADGNIDYSKCIVEVTDDAE